MSNVINFPGSVNQRADEIIQRQEYASEALLDSLARQIGREKDPEIKAEAIRQATIMMNALGIAEWDGITSNTDE